MILHGQLRKYSNSTLASANNLSNSTVPSIFGESSSILLIVILSILCFLGVIFMVFGPLMRSEALKRVDNFIFGGTSWRRNLYSSISFKSIILKVLSIVLGRNLFDFYFHYARVPINKIERSETSFVHWWFAWQWNLFESSCLNE